MNIVMTGATGFVGRALVARLLRDGHSVAALVRSPERAQSQMGAEARRIDLSDDVALHRAVGEADAIVNLAGENVFGGRWTDARRAALRESRVDLTRRLAKAVSGVERRPAVWIQASAVGYYGDRGDVCLDEGAPAGDDFLAGLCRDWEGAALGVERLGLRVAVLRIGVVLAGDGGALSRMRVPFAMGVGGRLGHGRQYVSWIHRRDLVEVITTALTDARYEGPINAVAPEAVTNRALTAALAKVLRRPAVLPVPRVALWIVFGDAAQVLLASQRVCPKRLEALGFRFAWPGLSGALEASLGTGPAMSRQSTVRTPDFVESPTRTHDS